MIKGFYHTQSFQGLERKRLSLVGFWSVSPALLLAKSTLAVAVIAMLLIAVGYVKRMNLVHVVLNILHGRHPKADDHSDLHKQMMHIC